jgi:hypothetical protein
MIAHLTTLSNFLAALSSVLAACFWFQASQGKDPPKALLGNSGWDAGVGVDTTPLVKWAQESSKLNKTAALWSAAAALFTFLAWGLGLLAHA